MLKSSCDDWKNSGALQNGHGEFCKQPALTAMTGWSINGGNVKIGSSLEIKK